MKSQEELREYSIETFNQVKPYLDEIDRFGHELRTRSEQISLSRYKAIENCLVGIYTYINPKYKEFEAKTDAYEDTYYNHLKIKSEIDGTKFVSEVANRASRAYASDLRIMGTVLEGWVKTIEQLLTTCRGHIYIERQEQKHV